MKFKILILIILFAGFSASAQKDLIITQAGEQIRCKILEESSMKFSFAYINNKGKITQTEIFKTLISSYTYNFYPEDLLPQEKIFSTKTTQKQKKTEPKNSGENASVENKSMKDASKKRTSVNNKTSEEISKKDEPKSAEVKTKKEASSSKNKPDKEIENEVVEAPIKLEKTKTPVIIEILPDSTNKPNVENKAEVEPVSEIQKEVIKVAGTPNPSISEKVIVQTEAKKEKGISNLPKKEEKVKSEFENFLKYRVGFKGGLSNIDQVNYDKSANGLFREKLMRGWLHGADFSIFLNDYFGLGLTYNNYQSSSIGKQTDIYINSVEGINNFDEIKTRVSHKFLGPTALFRLPLDFKTFIVSTISGGYIFYSEKGDLEKRGFESKYLHKGKTWGALGTLGLDFLIGDDVFGRDIILSFECGYNYAIIDKLNFNDNQGEIKLNQPLNLRRLDFTVGLRFTRFPRYLK